MGNKKPCSLREQGDEKFQFGILFSFALLTVRPQNGTGEKVLNGVFYSNNGSPNH